LEIPVRWSQQLIPTLKEVPQDAEIPSHQLMLRAGLIRKLSSGLYTFLPVGYRALRKVEQIVREEMDRAGALETLMPALHPAELWERTGRLEEMGPAMFNLIDRQKRAYVLGPTHEEVITELVAREVSSYKQLPINFYQIQTKYRDEIRPRFGLMRSKEFIMKDAYSFDVSWEAADGSYQAMYDAYTRIFRRCGLKTKAVEADSGAMGGNASHEFMVLADAGEDGVVECEACHYAANLEKAEGRYTTGTFDGAADAFEEVETPDKRTIEQVAEFLKLSAAQLVKTLIYETGEEQVAVIVPGDREVNGIKLARVLGGEPTLASEQAIEQVTGGPVGFVGPVGLGIRVIADQSLTAGCGLVTGANKADKHLKNVDLARDADIHAFEDLIIARTGDGCPRCDGTLQEKRGIEVGHVFKLGTKYSEALNANFLDQNGKKQPCVMGCYGIGINRTLASVIEQSHDDDGIIWPISVAPYQVEVLALNMKHEESVEKAEALVAALEAAGVDVLFDDRPARPGIKFKDADLLGLPIRVGFGERALAEGQVEVKLRHKSDVEKMPAEGIAERVLAIVAELKQALESEPHA
jgi:prolyl-tRNA synthetase